MKSVVLLLLVNLILVNSSITDSLSDLPSISLSDLSSDLSSDHSSELSSDHSSDLSSDHSSDLSSDHSSDLSSDFPSSSSTLDLFLSDSLTPESIKGTDKSNSTEESLIPENLILGFDNFIQIGNSIYFYAYKYLQEEPDKNFFIKLNIHRNLRSLQESENAECILMKEKSRNGISVYNCTLTNISGTFSRIECVLSEDLKLHPLAEYMCQNLQNQNGEKFSNEGIIILRDCKITDQDKKITISGVNDGGEIENGANSILNVISSDGNMINIPTQFTKNSDLNYNMDLDYKNPLKANLSGTLGRINEGKNFYLSFNNEDDAQLYFKGNSNTNSNVYKKKSSGLSTGAIVAIILPLIIVLLGVVGAVLLLRKKPSVPNAQMENINSANNTIGISSSSSNVVNK